jgi:hypothetical protein
MFKSKFLHKSSGEMYHGTRTKSVASILKYGLRPSQTIEEGKPVHDYAAVWANADKDRALHYAFFRTIDEAEHAIPSGPNFSKVYQKLLDGSDCALIVLDGALFSQATRHPKVHQSLYGVDPKHIKRVEIYNCGDLHRARLRTGYYTDAKPTKLIKGNG